MPRTARRSDGAGAQRRSGSAWSAPPPEVEWRVKTRELVETPAFGRAAVGLIVANTALMMCEYHHMPQWLAADLERANAALTLCFLWFVVTLSYYGLSFAAASLAGGLYLNGVLLALVELPVAVSVIRT